LRKSQGRTFSHSWANHYGQVGWRFYSWHHLSLAPTIRKYCGWGWKIEGHSVISPPRGAGHTGW
jgi:hypothetical protein